MLAGAQRRLVDVELVRIHRALHDGLAEAVRGGDEHDVAEAGVGIEREHDAARAEVAAHHVLHAGGQRDGVVIEALMHAIGDGAIVEQRGEHFVHRTCSTSSSPRTLRKVSCWPANEASGRSSAVAEERTATAMSRPPLMRSQRFAHGLLRAAGGNGVDRIHSRICAPTAASFTTSSTSSAASASRMRSSRPPCTRKSR